MTVRAPDHNTNSEPGAPLSAGYRVLSFAIAAVVLMVVAIVTHSAEAVVTAAGGLLLLLVWVSTGRAPRSDM